jgi:hypothetical protein
MSERDPVILQACQRDSAAMPARVTGTVGGSSPTSSLTPICNAAHARGRMANACAPSCGTLSRITAKATFAAVTEPAHTPAAQFTAFLSAVEALAA